MLPLGSRCTSPRTEAGRAVRRHIRKHAARGHAGRVELEHQRTLGEPVVAVEEQKRTVGEQLVTVVVQPRRLHLEKLARVLRIAAAELPDELSLARDLHVQARVGVADRVAVIRRVVVDRVRMKRGRVVDGGEIRHHGGEGPVLRPLDDRVGDVQARSVPHHRRDAARNRRQVMVRGAQPREVVFHVRVVHRDPRNVSPVQAAAGVLRHDIHVLAVPAHVRAAHKAPRGGPPDRIAVAVEDEGLGCAPVHTDDEAARVRGGVHDRHRQGLSRDRQGAGQDREVLAGACARAGGEHDPVDVVAARLHAEQQRPVARLRQVDGRGHRRTGGREAEPDLRAGDPGQVRREGDDGDRRDGGGRRVGGDDRAAARASRAARSRGPARTAGASRTRPAGSARARRANAPRTRPASASPARRASASRAA